MSQSCYFCSDPVSIEDDRQDSSWKEVVGWVGGPRKDSMKLRRNTGRVAHNDCVQKAFDGQTADQSSLPGFENKHEAVPVKLLPVADGDMP